MYKIMSWMDVESWIRRIFDLVPSLLIGLLILTLFWLFYRLTRRSVVAVLRRARLHDTLVDMLVRGVYRTAIMIFALIMAADQVGINVGAAVAGIGVTGIALGFAAKDTLANWIAGFLIFWDKPFEVEDWVSVGGQYGKVLEITMRSTRIRTNQNTWVVIPNQHIIDQVLVNHSKHGETRIDVPMGIAYKEDILAARSVILAAVARLEDVLADPAPDVVVTGLGSSSVDFNARVWIHDAGREQPVYYAVMEAAKLALDAAGIEIPYHHLQLFVEDVRDRVWQKAAALLPG